MNGGDSSAGIGGDRFIPNRTSLNFDASHYKVNLLRRINVSNQSQSSVCCFYSLEDKNFSI